MIPSYNVDNIVGNLDMMFQTIMKNGFVITIVLLTIWSILSLVIWSFRSKEKIRKSNKIWD